MCIKDCTCTWKVTRGKCCLGQIYFKNYLDVAWIELKT